MKPVQKLLLSLNFAFGMVFGAIMVDGNDHTLPLLTAAFIGICAFVMFLFSKD